jgi:hypothetical protein
MTPFCVLYQGVSLISISNFMFNTGRGGHYFPTRDTSFVS